MMDFLRFTFSGFWHFAGVMVLLSIVGETLVETVRALRPAKAAVPLPSIGGSAPGETR